MIVFKEENKKCGKLEIAQFYLVPGTKCVVNIDCKISFKEN